VEKMRKKLTLWVDSELVQQAKALGINLSRLTERTISSSIGNHTYMYVQNATVQPELQSNRNGVSLENPLENKTGRRVGCNPPSVLGDIHLIGIPAPRAGVHRRLLSLSRRGRVLSPYPPASSTQAHHLRQPAEVSFCALTRLLSRHLMVPRARYVDGVSSNPSSEGFGVAHQLVDPTLSLAEPGKQGLWVVRGA